MYKILITIATATVLGGCVTTYPSARLSGPSCAPTPEAMARVTYEEKRTYVELGCLGCSEVYLAAEQRWLKTNYPQHVVLRHYTASTMVGDPEPARTESCWTIQTPDGHTHDECFTDSGWCRERKKNPRESA
jgi:hypothetical protein